MASVSLYIILLQCYFQNLNALYINLIVEKKLLFLLSILCKIIKNRKMSMIIYCEGDFRDFRYRFIKLVYALFFKFFGHINKLLS